jgi:hypothetical protein
MYSPSQPRRTRRKKLHRADRPARKKLHALARVETKPARDEISPRTAHRKILEARKGVM